MAQALSPTRKLVGQCFIEQGSIPANPGGWSVGRVWGAVREQRGKGPIMEGHVEITDYFVISVYKDY